MRFNKSFDAAAQGRPRALRAHSLLAGQVRR